MQERVVDELVAAPPEIRGPVHVDRERRTVRAFEDGAGAATEADVMARLGAERDRCLVQAGVDTTEDFIDAAAQLDLVERLRMAGEPALRLAARLCD